MRRVKCEVCEVYVVCDRSVIRTHDLVCMCMLDIMVYQILLSVICATIKLVMIV